MSGPQDPIYPHFFAHAVGNYDAFMFPMTIASEHVDDLLPDKLERAEQTLAPEGQHPVLLMFGSQYNVRPNFVSKAFGMNYDEFVFVIPYIQWKSPAGKSYQGPFAFMPKLFLNEVWPTLLGHLLYAYAKELARIDAGANYLVHSLVLDKPLIHGDFIPIGTPRSPHAVENFAPIQEILEQPLVSKHTVGPYLCSKLAFDFGSAKILGCEASVEIEHEFLEGIPPQKFARSSLLEVPMGAFKLMTSWTLTLPFGPQRIEE